MSRIKGCFERLKSEGRKALIPYITAGDPDQAVTLPMMQRLVESGADIIELGIPFSDPMADGPVIQRAAERAQRLRLVPVEPGRANGVFKLLAVRGGERGRGQSNQGRQCDRAFHRPCSFYLTGSGVQTPKTLTVSPSRATAMDAMPSSSAIMKLKARPFS